MKYRLVIIILSILIGIAAVAGVYLYINSVQKKYEEEGIKQPVVVAKANIPGETVLDEAIDRGMLEKKEIPKKYVSEGSINNFEALSGKVLKVDVSKGQQITSAMITTTRSAGVSFQLQKGLRAIALEVNSVTGVSGKIRSGDRVDIIASFGQNITEDGKPMAKTILQNVLVLEGLTTLTEEESKSKGLDDNQAVKVTPERRTVVLAVSLTDAEKLVFSVENGKTWIVLRPAGEEKVEKTPGYTIETVIR